MCATTLGSFCCLVYRIRSRFARHCPLCSCVLICVCCVCCVWHCAALFQFNKECDRPFECACTRIFIWLHWVIRQLFQSVYINWRMNNFRVWFPVLSIQCKNKNENEREFCSFWRHSDEVFSSPFFLLIAVKSCKRRKRNVLLSLSTINTSCGTTSAAAAYAGLSIRIDAPM